MKTEKTSTLQEDSMILKGLNKEQLTAVTSKSKHLLIFAGPGTGKTRVITHRMAYLVKHLGIDPETILGITFTNRAAHEMKKRVSGLLGNESQSEPWLGTFHAFSNWLLREFHKEAGLPQYFAIYDHDDSKRLIRNILTSQDLPTARAGIYLEIIQRQKDDLMDAKSYAIHSQVSFNPHRASIAKVYTEYQEALRTHCALDFGDLIVNAVNLLNNSDAVQKKLHERFSYVFVDEYQDTNRAQYILTKLLVGSNSSIAVVGDEDQIIYQWRGANPRHILDFDKDFEGAKHITISQNYRSTQKIIAAAKKLIEKNEVRKPKELCANRHEGSDPVIIEVLDDKQEAKTIARRIKTLMDEGIRLNEIAVFYRTNAQSRNFEIEFSANKLPYRLIGAVGFYVRREIKDIMAMAKILANPSDRVSLGRVLSNISQFSITQDAMKKIKDFGEREKLGIWETLELASRSETAPISQRAKKKIQQFLHANTQLLEMMSAKPTIDAIFESIFEHTGYLEGLDEERVLNLMELVESAKEFSKEHSEPNLLEFLNHTSLLTGSSIDNHRSKTTDGVNLLTVHLAKGLEFNTVFLTGLEEEMFPFKISKHNPDELEEERRLFYVGITRAKDSLFLSYAKKRMIFGSETQRPPSRFLYEAGFLEGQWQHKPRFRHGSRVKHPIFGEGRILSITGADDGTKITIRFISGSTRKFLAKLAPLELI
ncbi:ATP-dependent helicase [Elusimicrobiota bacterium]